ncbi:PH domain-containing protein [Arenimonas sp.]|uniref:PH domain-containing protein n=1 Tax=Arenimonas sp. TaxID=1872635 RepID=UPI0035B04088
MRNVDAQRVAYLAGELEAMGVKAGTAVTMAKGMNAGAAHPPAQVSHPPRARRGFVFLVIAVAVVAGNAWLVRNYPSFAEGPAPEWPVMFDLLLFLPALYFALNWRQGKTAALKALGILGLGALAGSLILPPESKVAWRLVEDLRFVAIALVLAFQLGVLVLLLREAARSQHDQNLELALAQAIGKRFGQDGFARLLMLESRIWLYGLFRRPVRHAFPGLRHFHVGKQGLNADNQKAFLFLIGAEIPIAHFLIHLFSPTAALVVTALSAYGFVFMLAEYRATLFRPVSVTERGLHLRYGVASDFVLPWENIASVAPTRGPVRRAKGLVRLVGMGEANVAIELVPGTVVDGLFGPREVGRVLLGVDEPAALIEEIRARLC